MLPDSMPQISNVPYSNFSSLREIILNHLRNSFRLTQSPGARSNRQNLQPLQVRRPQAFAAANDGEV